MLHILCPKVVWSKNIISRVDIKETVRNYPHPASNTKWERKIIIIKKQSEHNKSNKKLGGMILSAKNLRSEKIRMTEFTGVLLICLFCSFWPWRFVWYELLYLGFTVLPYFCFRKIYCSVLGLLRFSTLACLSSFTFSILGRLCFGIYRLVIYHIFLYTNLSF